MNELHSTLPAYNHHMHVTFSQSHWLLHACSSMVFALYLQNCLLNIVCLDTCTASMLVMPCKNIYIFQAARQHMLSSAPVHPEAFANLAVMQL